MEFAEVVRRRRMVRQYRADPVETAVLERVLDSAARGPSAGWAQAVRFVVVTSASARSAIADVCGEASYRQRGFAPWLSMAPVHVVVTVRVDDYRRRYGEPDKEASRGPDAWHTPFWWVDAGAALQLLLLAAVDEGLGAGVLDVASPARLRSLLGIPDDVQVVVLVTLGYPADPVPPATSSLRRGRRPIDDVVRWERWGGEEPPRRGSSTGDAPRAAADAGTKPFTGRRGRA